MEESTEAFERIVSGLDYPMFVVTTIALDGRRAGCLVGFTSQVSINPPRFLVGLSNTNFTYRVAAEARHLGVHVIGRDHRGLAELFGTETGDEVDKFDRCDWRSGPHGVPVLRDAAAWFAGEIIDRVPLGDHMGILLAAESGEAPGTLPPLITSTQVMNLNPGHAP